MILSEKRKIRWWKFGEWARSFVPEIGTAVFSLSAKTLAALKKLPEALRWLRQVWRDRVPQDLSIALGVPLLVALLMALTGWPVSWTGQAGKDAGVGLPPPGFSQTAKSVAAPEAPAAVPDAETASRIRQLEEELAGARSAELESGKILARLRADHETELGLVQEQRDKAVLKLAELESALAAQREAQAREEAARKVEREQSGEERRKATEKAQELERRIRVLEMANVREKARAEAAEEKLRRREAEQRTLMPEQFPEFP